MQKNICWLARLIRVGFTGLGLGLVLGAFAPADAGTIRHDVADTAYRNLAKPAAFAAAGRLRFDTATSSNSLCSGTVIDAHWVLTAAHCVDDANAMRFQSYDPITSTHRSYVSASRWLAHPLWERGLRDGWDLGLVYFDEALSAPAASLYRDRQELGSTLTLVGYGSTGTGLTGALDSSPSARRGGQNMVDRLLSDAGDREQLMWFDFDHPSNKTFNYFNWSGYSFDDLALPMEYSTAAGDSGAGAFLYASGQWFLAGVHSFSGNPTGGPRNTYGDYFAMTRVSSLYNWIEATTVPAPAPFLLLLAGVWWLRRRPSCPAA